MMLCLHMSILSRARSLPPLLQSHAFYEMKESRLRWKMQDLPDWSWEPLRDEFEKHLPLRWWLIQHIAANPRDPDLTFAPFTNAYWL